MENKAHAAINIIKETTRVNAKHSSGIKDFIIGLSNVTLNSFFSVKASDHIAGLIYSTNSDNQDEILDYLIILGVNLKMSGIEAYEFVPDRAFFTEDFLDKNLLSTILRKHKETVISELRHVLYVLRLYIIYAVSEFSNTSEKTKE